MAVIFRKLNSFWLLLFLTIVMSFLNSVDAETMNDSRYLSLIMLDSPNSKGTRLGARRVDTSADYDVAVLDFVADKLHRHYRSNSYEPDTIAWLAKILGNSGNARYRTVLQEVLKDAPDEKITRYTEVALKKLVADGEEQYQPSNENMSAVRQMLAEKRKTNPDKQKQQVAFNALSNETLLRDVFKALGYPEAASSDMVVRDLPRAGKRKMQQMLLKYQGIGLVRLTKDKGGWRVFDKMMYPPIEGAFPTEPIDLRKLTLVELMDLLWTWDVYDMTTAYKSLSERALTDEQLDIIAHRVWLGISEQDPFTDKGLARLAKLITLSRSPRYAHIMWEVADNALGPKLRKHARKAAKMSEKMGKRRKVEQLQPLRELRSEEIRESTVDKLKGYAESVSDFIK